MKLVAKNKNIIRRLFDEFYGGANTSDSDSKQTDPARDKSHIADAFTVLTDLGVIEPSPQSKEQPAA